MRLIHPPGRWVTCHFPCDKEADRPADQPPYLAQSL